MATTGELQAILQKLHMVEVGDAASYLGEEAMVEDELSVYPQEVVIPVPDIVLYPQDTYTSCQTLCA